MNILVFGDILFDLYCYGDIERFCPEAPIPVLTKVRERCSLGGAGNTAINLAKILPDDRIILVGRWNEQHAKMLTQQLPKNLYILPDFSLNSDPIIKKRFIDQKSRYQLLRVDNERMLNIKPLDRDLVPLVKDFQPKCVVFSDYCKGTLADRRIIEWVIGEIDCPIVIDTKAHNIDKYQWTSYITPNLSELNRMMAHYEVGGPGALIKKLGLDGILLTRSEDGMDLYDQERNESGDRILSLNLKTRVEHLVDVTGAGDAAIAGFAALLALGYTSLEATWYANYYAGLACTQHGTDIELPPYYTITAQYNSEDFAASKVLFY